MSFSNRQILGMAVFAVAVMAMGAGIRAQELEISVPPAPIGSGARAAGMADAFVAIADDATAASWNPAGLVQLERPEFSAVAAYNSVYELFESDGHSEFDSHHYSDNFDLNYLSLAVPLPVLFLGRNVCVSLNYQTKYDFSRSFTFDLHQSGVTSKGRVINNFQAYAFEQTGSLGAFSPAIAVELNHRLSLGAAFNFWQPAFGCENRWQQTTKARVFSVFDALGFLSSFEVQERYEHFRGRNVTLGLLWAPTGKLSFGMRYDTAFTGETQYRKRSKERQLSLQDGFSEVLLDFRQEKRHIHFPDALALGAAWRPNDRLTFSVDVTRIDWNDFYARTADGQHRSLVDYSSLDNPWTRTHLEPAYTARFGVEYVFLPKEPEQQLSRLWTVRGGLFRDQEPATGKPRGFRWPGDNGGGVPDTFYGCAVGAGLLLNQRVNIDAAYQLRCGHGVNRDMIRGVDDFEESTFQHRFLLSAVVYF